ncbi:MAG: MoaD/ThiS family protein [Myxococcota bacterium]
MPNVKIPPPYQGPTEGRALVDVEGATVGACLEALCAQYPDFRQQLYDGQGAIHKFVTLFVNGDEIERSALDRSVEASDEIEILAAIAGG